MACPADRLCFAVGQAVAFGAGNAPGVPLIERWDARRWRLVRSPAAAAPLSSISCASPRACTAVGGFEHTVGGAQGSDQHVEYPSVLARWNGSVWSASGFSPPAGADGAALLGVSCTSAAHCLGVGSEVAPVGYGGIAYQDVDQAITGSGDGSAFTGAPLAFPAGVYRAGPGPTAPSTFLTAIACAPTDPDSCAAVGGYRADNGAIGPLAAGWNGSSWTPVALRRGPVQLTSVACPALGWCMAVGDGIAELYVG